MARFHLSRIWHIPTFGSPVNLLLVSSPRCHPSTQQTALQAQVEHDHERRSHHLAPPLIEGCGCHVIKPAEANRAGDHQRAGDRMHFTTQRDSYTCCLLHNDVPAQAGPGSPCFGQLRLQVSTPCPLARVPSGWKQLCNIFLWFVYGIFYPKFYFLDPPALALVPGSHQLQQAT